MESQQFREAATSTIDEIITYFSSLPSRHVVSPVKPGYLRHLLPSSPPETGEPWPTIQSDINRHILPGITHWQHPSFHAFFPCASTFPSVLGELYSSFLSGANFNWICSPAATELETIVLDWLVQMLGLPGCFLSTGEMGGEGVILGTASEAVLTVMVAAREKFLHERLGDGERTEEEMERLKGRMVVLGSSATHSSTKKAAKILGLRSEAIPVNGVDQYALTGAKLKTYLGRLRERGLEPFFLTATMGTTDTCAVDDFVGISEVLKAYTQDTNREVWVHVDAAHAGAALICPEVRDKIRVNVFKDFHSFDTNMNKWMLVNLDASCLFIKDRNWLIRAFSVNQAVYDNHHSEGGLVTDYREWQIPLSRRFRALKIWFVMRTYGVQGIREYIWRTMGLAERFGELLKMREDLFEILAGPNFALVVFSMVGRIGQEEIAEDKLGERNKLTRLLCEKVNGSGKVWVTSTVLDGRFAIRFMTAVSTTEGKHIDMAFELFVKLAEEVQGAKTPDDRYP